MFDTKKKILRILGIFIFLNLAEIVPTVHVIHGLQKSRTNNWLHYTSPRPVLEILLPNAAGISIYNKNINLVNKC